MKIVTIAIPSLHRPDLTATCLTFLEKQTLAPGDWEAIVIENEAQPQSILPDPLPAHTTRIELTQNEGTTGSINRAVAASQSRYILLLNNDVELQPDYLQKLIAGLESDVRLGFAAGKLLRATQRTHLDGAGDAALVAGASYRLGHRDTDDGQYQQPMPILSGCGAAVLYRRDVFEACGRLDEDFFAYLDDLDLALRSQLLGYSGLYVPDAVGYHVGSATLGETMNPRLIELLTRNQLWLLAKDYPRRVLRRLMPRIVAYQAFWLGRVLHKREFSAYLRGWRSALKGMGAMRRKHRELMLKHTLTDEEFLARLRASERQIYEWQQTIAPEQRSTLLEMYFRLFGKP